MKKKLSKTKQNKKKKTQNQTLADNLKKKQKPENLSIFLCHHKPSNNALLSQPGRGLTKHHQPWLLHFKQNRLA